MYIFSRTAKASDVSTLVQFLSWCDTGRIPTTRPTVRLFTHDRVLAPPSFEPPWLTFSARPPDTLLSVPFPHHSPSRRIADLVHSCTARGGKRPLAVDILVGGEKPAQGVYQL